MSLILEKPFVAELSDRDILSSLKPRLSRSQFLRFTQLAMATEVIGDLIASAISVAGVFLSYSYLRPARALALPLPQLLGVSISFSILFVVMLDREGVYSQGSGMLRIRETERTLRASLLSFLVIYPVAIMAHFALSPLLLGAMLLTVPITVITEKQAVFSFVRFLHARGRGVQRAIIYGAGYTGKRVYSALLRSRKLGLNPIGLVDDDQTKVGQTLKALGYSHIDSELVIQGPITLRMIKEMQADLVIVAIPTIAQSRLAEIATLAKQAGVSLSFVPNQPPHESLWVNYLDIDGIMLGSFAAPVNMHGYEFSKRVFDLIVSMIILVIFSPFFALLALGVRLDSEGPIIFKQHRVGKNGKLFEIYKFRTMKAAAPKYDLSPTKSEDWRITRFGRLLRKTSLDELPQLLNVLKGDMSLVGPRPEMPFIVQTYGPRERLRLSVIPGITGLWQLSADRSYLIHENPHYDLYYIRNRGFFMDIAILLHTAIFAIRGV
jgi:exopolysaccharide biosynthesis polyprenyl glycosylphosphotransferase